MKLNIDTTLKINYPVINTLALFDDAKIWEQNIGKIDDLFIIVDSNVYELYGNKINLFFEQVLQCSLTDRVYIFDAHSLGEAGKTLETVEEILKQVVKLNLNRRSTIFGIGGGVVLDITGVVSQLYRRSVRHVKIPTTLIGMVDAGIAVKCGVNFAGKKNVLGSFYPPVACMNDLTFLKSLSHDDLRQGIAEIVKLGLIYDKSIIELCERGLTFTDDVYADILKFNGLEEIIARSISGMLENLEPNLYEYELMRLVDYGHTFSPDIEMLSKNTITHGFAVAIDMAITTVVAYKLGKCTEEIRDYIINLLLALKLPIYDEFLFDKNIKLKISAGIDYICAHRGGKLNLPYAETVGVGKFIQKEDFHGDSKDVVMFALEYLEAIYKTKSNLMVLQKPTEILLVEQEEFAG